MRERHQVNVLRRFSFRRCAADGGSRGSRCISWLRPVALCVAACLLPMPTWAGTQQYEPLSASVQAALSGAIADKKPPGSSFKDYSEAVEWLSAMSERLARRVPDQEYRLELLRAIHYEATRAGLDPQLVLGLIQVESGFRKYAVSSAGARGYMQVMPFWVKLIGTPNDNLFHLRTNLRYGCTILRHYLDIEKGDLFRALGRYNGSLGRAEYPNLVRGAWEQWRFEKRSKSMPVSAAAILQPVASRR